MNTADIALAVAVSFFWGLNFVVAKLGLTELPPMAMMTARFALVTLLLVPFVRAPVGRMREIAILSFTFGLVHFSLMFTGLQYVDAGVAALAIQIQVPFAALLAAVLYGDRPGWRRTVGMVVAIAGVAIVVGRPDEGSELWAVGLIVLSALVWAVANIQMQRLSDLNGFTVNGWLALFALPQLAAASLVLESGQWQVMQQAGWLGWGSVAYQAVIVVVLCYGVWYRLLRRYGVGMVMPYTVLVPVFGVIAGAVLLSEPLTWNVIVGGIMTITGVGIIVIRRPRLTENTPRTG